MITVIIISVISLTMLAFKDMKIEELKAQLAIKTSENLTLKMVMCENNLIPKEYVK